LLRAAQVKTNGEFGALQYAAHGGVKINARTASGKLIVELEIRPGWHINAHEPLSKNLIPTSLTEDTEPSIWSLTDISYPQPITKKLGFQSEKLALYEGNVRLTARLQQNQSVPVLPPLRIKLRLQACDEKVCLPPENLVLQVPVR
jgi:DsbC/DsbD-like thiol-disulfide interchange protein